MPVVVGALRWAGPLAMAWVASKIMGDGAEIAKSGEQSVDHLTKAAPWIVGGLAVYMLARGR